MQPLVVTVSKKHILFISKSLETPRHGGDLIRKTFLNQEQVWATGLDAC